MFRTKPPGIRRRSSNDDGGGGVRETEEGVHFNYILLHSTPEGKN